MILYYLTTLNVIIIQYTNTNKNIMKYSEQTNEFNVFVSTSYVSLVQLKKEGKTKAFNDYS